MLYSGGSSAEKVSASVVSLVISFVICSVAAYSMEELRRQKFLSQKALKEFLAVEQERRANAEQMIRFLSHESIFRMH